MPRRTNNPPIGREVEVSVRGADGRRAACLIRAIRFSSSRIRFYGVIPIDNGVERLPSAPRPRKNFLFVGSDARAESAAIADSILGCCKLADVNPVEYLADVLPRLTRPIRLRDVPDILPARWKERRTPRLA